MVLLYRYCTHTFPPFPPAPLHHALYSTVPYHIILYHAISSNREHNPQHGACDPRRDGPQAGISGRPSRLDAAHGDEGLHKGIEADHESSDQRALDGDLGARAIAPDVVPEGLAQACGDGVERVLGFGAGRRGGRGGRGREDERLRCQPEHQRQREERDGRGAVGGGDGWQVDEVRGEVSGEVGDVGGVEDDAVYRCGEEGRRGLDREVRHDGLVRDSGRLVGGGRHGVLRGEGAKEPERDVGREDVYEERRDDRRGVDIVEGTQEVELHTFFSRESSLHAHTREDISLTVGPCDSRLSEARS